MKLQSDICVQALISFATATLSGKTLTALADICKFQCGLFDGKKKYHLLRETAFLTLFIVHSVCQNNKIPSEKINVAFNEIYKLRFKEKEEIKSWFSDLVGIINQYIKSASSEKGGGVFGVAGLFLIRLKSFDKTFPGFEQFAVADYIGKLTALLEKGVEKYNLK